ncbi:M56 family metallopeptidase [Christiangramia crocea]|uniref:Peptidase M56 domain-containing protein n=1 Tax=Christiangramia crocea TaxID=2904124 RepID=A0A9X2A623_9FLAO|nr:hypothetical protein [Gramella crocea]
MLFSFIIPLITFSYNVENLEDPGAALPLSQASGIDDNTKNESWSSYLMIAALVTYITGFLIMGFRFGRNLYSIQKDIRNNQKLKSWNYIYVLLRQKLIPHTFLNYIFLDKAEYENDQISESVMEHEKAHVDQKHSLDILFIEFLQIVFWFNPVFILLKRSVKLNHEFLADQQVLSKKTDALEYSNILLNYGAEFHQNSLSSSISNSLIKKRIIMISKSFSLKRFLSRIGFFIPVLALCIYFFNNDIVAKPVAKNIYNKENIEPRHNIQDPGKISIRVQDDNIFVNGEQIELKALVDHLDAMVEAKNDTEIKKMSFHIQTKNPEEGVLDRLNTEFKKTRFSEVTGHTVFPPPPPAPSGKAGPPPSPPAPSATGNIPPPPPAPKNIHKDVPAPPPAPRIHERKHDSLSRVHRNKRDLIREEIRIERELRREEMQRKREAHLEKVQQQRDSIRQQHKIVVRKEIQARRAEISEERAKIREKQEVLREEKMRLKEKAEKEKQNQQQKKKDSL